MEKLAKIKSYVLNTAVVLAILTPTFLVIAAVGTNIGLWGWKFGFGKLTVDYGTKLMMLTFFVALIALVFALMSKPRKGWLTALLCLALPAVGLGFGKNMKTKARSLPFIHDITTDTQNPPSFTQGIIVRRELNKCSNALGYVGATIGTSGTLVSAAQVKAYPDVRTLVFSDSPSDLYKRAFSVVEDMGWQMATTSEERGIIEATESSFWFGFKDDIAIRIRPSEGGGSILDMRSVSCDGGSDIGVNANRIRRFRDKLGR